MTHDDGAAGAEVSELELVLAEMEGVGAGLPSKSADKIWQWAQRLRSALRAPQPQEAKTHKYEPDVYIGSPCKVCRLEPNHHSHHIVAALRAPQEGDRTTIELSPADQTQLVDALLNPPEPNDALRKAMSRHIAPQEGKDRQ